MLCIRLASYIALAHGLYAANTYTTAFPLTENPISESGNWINGGVTGGSNFHNVRTTARAAFGTQPGGQGNCSGVGQAACGDSTAVLTGSWGATQTVQAVVYVIGSPSDYSEVELRLRTTITSGSITGYEFNCSVVPGDAYMQIVRWNGGLGNFTLIDARSQGCVNGDVLKATGNGSTLTIYKNGSAVFSVIDSTYTNGSPGIGMFATNTSGNANYGFSSFIATDSAIIAPTCSQSDTVAAITAASSGGTVVIPPGNCSWTSVSLNKALTFEGTGQGITNIDVSVGNPVFTITKQSAAVTRITDFTFTATNNAVNLPHPILVQGSWPGGQPVIFQRDTFTCSTATMIDIYLAGGVIFSQIIFNGLWNDFLMAIKDLTNVSSWTTADSMGTSDSTGLKNIYIEDSVFNGGSNGIIDCDDNCRVVMRYNSFIESGGFNSHGEDSSQYGMRHFEIYNNSFTFPDTTCTNGSSSLSNINQYIWIRGATGVIYNNSFANLTSSCWGDKPEVKINIRGAEDDRPQGTCGQVSYPVPHQLGQNHNGSALFTDPIYIWGNSGTATVNSGWGWGNPCSFNWTTFFQYGRDGLITGNPSCSSTGCTVNAIGTSTAKPGWTPYTYPHPLVGASAPIAPTIITTCPLTSGTVGASYSQQMTASGDSPITWDLSTGSWPTNITMTSGGMVSGTPTVVGTSNFTLRATNATGNNTEACSLTISSVGPAGIIGGNFHFGGKAIH